MRQILLGVLLVTLTFSSSARGEGTARCATIVNHDERMTCFAVSTRNSSYCHFVKDSSKRAWCHVLLGK